MAAGRLAPDALVTGQSSRCSAHRDGYVLDGYPRKLAQADGLDFDAVVYLDVPDEVDREAPARPRPADDTEDVIARAAARVRARTRSRSSSTTASSACWSRSTATVPRTRSPPTSQAALQS